MKKLLLVLVLVFICTFAFTACNDSEDDTVSPLPAQTIAVSTVEDLANLNNYLGIQYINYTFSLSNNIDLSAIKQWNAIGTQAAPFMAKFTGNSFTIDNLTYIGIDGEGNPTVNEVSNLIGLFGYTQNTVIENLNLTKVNINCYTSGDYFYTAGLVAYNTGASVFNNISVTGNILLSNIYTYNTTYGMDGEIQDSHVVTCDTTQYAGGLVAYSSGSTTFSNINVNFNIANNNYRAVYDIVYAEVDGEQVVESEGYYIHQYNSATYLPSQSLAGLMGGYIKNGAAVENITVTGGLILYSQSVYGACGVAILTSSTADNFTVNDCTIISKASEKVGASGAIALLDSSLASDLNINDISITAETIADSIKNVSIGGIVSYCYDRASLTDSIVTNLTVSTTEKAQLQLGGIAGVVRDATIESCRAEGTFVIPNRKVEIADYAKTAGLIYAVYGNSIISNNYADINVTLALNGVTSLQKNPNGCASVNNTSYVNEDGKTVARFANASNISDYVEVYVTHDNANEIVATYCDDEGVELSVITYTIDDAQYTADTENCFKYINVYYSAAIGLLNAQGNVLEIDQRSFALYTQVTGVPVLTDNTFIWGER